VSEEGLPGIEAGREVVSQRRFARLVGVSQPSISEAITNGRLSAACVCQTKAGKQLYLEAAMAEWVAIHAAEEVGQPIEGEEARVELNDDIRDLRKIKWGLVKTKFEALVAQERGRILALERKQLEAKLHREEDVAAVWEEKVARCRALMLTLPGKVAGEIGLRTKRDRIAVQMTIEAAVREALTELSEHSGAEVVEQRKRRTGRE
jgi:hypothetical protein